LPAPNYVDRHTHTHTFAGGFASINHFPTNLSFTHILSRFEH
jgi:hypothetical protein